MPNWCENGMVVNGMSAEDFIEKYSIETDEYDEFIIDFEKIVPIGEWEYDKAVDAWGTKWGDVEAIFTETEDGFIVGFDTAWSSPFPIVNALREQNPNATFDLYYMEPGEGFCGFNKKDELFEDSISDINLEEIQDEFFKRFLEDVVDEEF